MSKFRALVVDDEPQVRQMTARSLSRLGFDCETACNGQDALEWIQATAFDLVVTDLKMPEVNGHKLATELLALPQHPVIAILTGVEEPKLAKDLTARGVEKIFYKPVNFSEFAQDILYSVEQRAELAKRAKIRSGACNQETAVEQLSSSHALPPPEESETPDASNTNGGKDADTHETSLEDLFPTCSGPLTAPAPQYQSAPAAAIVPDEYRDSVHLSRALSNKIDAELGRTKQALIDLQRTIAAGQTSSYINVLIALSAGLVFGLIAGWISSHILTKFAT
jgi:CheY-like chemotaxis protein